MKKSTNVLVNADSLDSRDRSPRLTRMFVPPRGASAGSHHVPAGTHRLPTRNLPLQSLSGRSFRAASPKANCSSTPRRIRSGCPDSAPPVAWRCHSLGVNGFFRVYTLGSSSLLVCYLGSNLSPLGSVPAVFLPGASWSCCQNQKTPLMNFISPSELSSHRCLAASRPTLPTHRSSKYRLASRFLS